MASPMVAGVAALVLTRFPTLTDEEIFQRLQDKSDNIDSLNAGFEGLLGQGRLNAASALVPDSSISTVSPSTASILDTTASLTITGIEFTSDLVITLTKSGQTSISATSQTIASSTTATANFDLTQASVGGRWNLTMAKSGLTLTETNALGIKSNSFDIVNVDNTIDNVFCYQSSIGSPNYKLADGDSRSSHCSRH